MNDITTATAANAMANANPISSPTYSIPGVKVMLEGDSGVGKTLAIVTLIEAGITPFIIFTEPGVSTISKWLADNPEVDPEKIHWHYISMSTQSWGDMETMSKNINTLSYKALTGIVDAKKAKYNQFLEVYKTCHDFVDDRTGEHFGDISDFGTDRAVFFDSLSGLSTMSMNLAVGAKPTKSPGDWGIAMDNLERFITKICTDLHCHMVLSAHISMEKDEISGGIILMAQSLGNKLSPKLPRYFDEVVHATKVGDKFAWSTASRNVSTKNRWLALGDNLPPSFVPMIESWKKAGGKIQSA